MEASELSKNDFENIFGHSARYGVAEDWGDKKEARLFYKFSSWTRNKHSCWMDFRNIKHYKEKDLDTCLHLFIVLDKSPCSDCSKKLIELKEKNEKLQISVKFSSFYNTYEKYDNASNEKHLANIQGLINLIKKGIKLHVFEGLEDWKTFLEHVVKVPADDQEAWLKCVRTSEKREREKIDAAILDDIRGQSLSLEDIQKMASATSSEGIENEIKRRNGEFVFKEGSAYKIENFHGFSKNPDFMLYFSRVGSENWTQIPNNKGSHAEAEMIEHISSNVSLNIIAENSPCKGCCEMLKAFKGKYPFLHNIQIRFWSFNTNGNFKALIDYVSDGNELYLINGEEGWTRFIQTFCKGNSADPNRHQDANFVKEDFKEVIMCMCEKEPVNGAYLLDDIRRAAGSDEVKLEDTAKLARCSSLGDVRKEAKRRIKENPNNSHLLKRLKLDPEASTSSNNDEDQQ